ncbi:DHA1 family putative efflux transporter-like MFS transporter [Croceifilum oryzae]|uniref:DHA1 family putative efflux transporter-like MFS transporter n=1 Tax=Croceifilum oryzae TaxID=1553429 RepID=A0AAJ1WT30_9BACL|nr:MFS transporter [Croceifilum oryzae]MDQ0418360.1 DHA1 family putative efflux transporter-like MFS transporter [Croceifilum oryzae]
MSNTWKIYILALASFLVGTSEYVISGTLDKIAHTLGITIGAAGQLITIFSLVYAIFTPISMALTASMDRRKLMMYALGLFVVGNIIAYTLPGYRWFLVARIIMALGAGIVVVNALSIAAKIAPEGKRASAIATVVMGFTASLIIGVPIGRTVAAAFGWKSVFGGIALLGLLIMLVLYLILPQIKGDKPVPLLKQLALFKNPKIVMGLSITFFSIGGYAIAFTYLSPYLLRVSGISESMMSGILLMFGIASLIGSKFGGFSTDRWGVSSTLIGGMTLHIMMLILLSVVTGSYIGVMIILILWSFAAWTTGPTQQYNLATLEPEASTVLLGINQSMMQLAMAVGAGVGGIFVDKVSLSSVTWIGALGVSIAMIVTFMLFSKQKASNLKEVT